MQNVIVVGGGLAGLVTATLCARSGLDVEVLERGTVGGRARQAQASGFTFNTGPHALYARGAAMAALERIGVEVPGAPPDPKGLLADADALHALPAEPVGLLTGSGLSVPDRVRFAALMATLGRRESEALRGLSVEQWLARDIAPGLHDTLRVFVRLTTFCADTEHLCAAAALRQLQLGSRGVVYVEPGWGELVDRVRRRAEDAGERVERVDRHVVQGPAARLPEVPGRVDVGEHIPALANRLLLVIAAEGGAADRPAERAQRALLD